MIPGRQTTPDLPYATRAPAPPPSERLRTVRTFIIAVVVMWIALMAAWAVERASRESGHARRLENVEDARQRLAGMPDISSVFAEVNTAVEPAVVKLDVVRVTGRTGPFGRAAPEANHGSGVIMETDGEVGYLLTNNHVVANASQIVVTLFDGRTVGGRVIGTEEESDLAVVMVEAEHLIPAKWGNSDTLRKGDWVLAFGSPFNFVGSMTAGIVSALNRTQNDGIETPLGPDAYQDFIQVDAAINPGNSGGPLANLRGEIVGINTAIFSRTGEFSGIGFAIPSNQARRVYEDIRRQGRFIRGWLGVSVLPVQAAPQVARQLGFDSQTGVFVDSIFRDTPAAESGLRRLDIIVSVNGRPVRDDQGLKNVTAFTPPGQTVELEVFRDGEMLKLPVKIGAMPDDTMLLGLEPQLDPSELGMTLTDSRQGAVQIATVAPKSPADQAGLRPGDFILRVGNQPVRTASQAGALLSQLDPRLGIELTVVSGNRTFNVVLRT